MGNPKTRRTMSNTSVLFRCLKCLTDGTCFIFSVMGETVNVANMVERMSEGMKIHITKTTKNLLAGSGKFRTEYRGIMDIGNKQLETYWLLGFDRDLDSDVMEKHDK